MNWKRRTRSSRICKKPRCNILTHKARHIRRQRYFVTDLSCWIRYNSQVSKDQHVLCRFLIFLVLDHTDL